MIDLAINGGLPIRKETFPPWPFFDSDEIAAVSAVLRSGKVNYWTGENAVVGTFSFVNKDIPDNALAFGVPARVVRK